MEADRFWGNLLRLLQRFLPVNLRGISSGGLSLVEANKVLRVGLGATAGYRAGHRLPKRPARFSIHAPGVGIIPLQCLDVSGYWLSRLCRAPNPARAI